MPARSKKQQMAAGAALSAKRGETSKSQLKGASKQMAELDVRKGIARSRQHPAKETTGKERCLAVEIVPGVSAIRHEALQPLEVIPAT